MDKGREEHWGWGLHSTPVEIVGPSPRISIPSTDNVGDQEIEELEEVGYCFFSFLFFSCRFLFLASLDKPEDLPVTLSPPSAVSGSHPDCLYR